MLASLADTDCELVVTFGMALGQMMPQVIMKLEARAHGAVEFSNTQRVQNPSLCKGFIHHHHRRPRITDCTFHPTTDTPPIQSLDIQTTPNYEQESIAIEQKTVYIS